MGTLRLSLGQIRPLPSARISEIDISGPARALGFLRVTDYTLVMGALAALGALPDFVSGAADGRWGEAAVQGLIAAALVFAAVTGWRHVGVIDPRVWRSYLWAFPLLASVGILASLGTALDLASNQKNPFDDIQTFLGLWSGLCYIGIGVLGLLCVLRLRRMGISPLGVGLGELLGGLMARGGEAAPQVTRLERPAFRRGIVYAGLGAFLLLVTILTPLPADTRKANAVYRLIPHLKTLACFLLVRARRYFQVSADSLLAVDRRPPILFLRSFTDDEKQQYGNSEKALLDFSLETRLANHFYHFGPFIAVGSPKDTVPQPGAARVLLGDDEWQSRVLGWMESASLIVMYCGTTKWVNWELQKIIERGRSTSLILMIPEVKGLRASKRRKDLAERVQQLREVFRNTEWNEELTGFDGFDNLRAMLFRPDGSIVMVRSRSRSRDSYHLAALIAHQQLLDPMTAGQQAAGAPKPVSTPHSNRRLRWKIGVAVAAAVLAMAGAGIGSVMQSRHAEQLRVENERREHERAEREERTRLEAELAATRDRERRDHLARDREAREQAERDRIALEQAANAQQAKLQAQLLGIQQQERFAREQAAARQRLAQEQAAAAEVARQRSAQEQAAAAEAARQRLAQEQAAAAEAARQRFAQEQAAAETARQLLARQQAAATAAAQNPDWRFSFDGKPYQIQISGGLLHIAPKTYGSLAADLPIKTNKKGEQQIMGQWQSNMYRGFLLIQQVTEQRIAGYMLVPTAGATDPNSCISRTSAFFQGMTDGMNNKLSSCQRVNVAWDRQ